MSLLNGTVGEIIKVLDISSVEMMALSLQESRIIDATKCLISRWGGNKYNLIGRQLSQDSDSPLSARYVSDEVNKLNTRDSTKIEITYRPDNDVAVTTTFLPQYLKDESGEYLILIRDLADSSDNNSDAQDKLALAVAAGGYALWDYDFRTGTDHISPELYKMLDYQNGDQRLHFRNFPDQVHPDDSHLCLPAAIDKDPQLKFWRNQLRCRKADNSYVWLEQIAALSHDPVTNSHAKAIGLCRDVSLEMEQLSRLETSERNLARSQQIANIGSWVFDIAANEMTWSDQMYRLFGALNPNAKSEFGPLLAAMTDASRERWYNQFERAKKGEEIKPFDCDFHDGSEEARRIKVHIHTEHSADGQVQKLHGICQEITDQIMLERKFLQAQKMESVGRLTGGIAHDFNNLLMVMIGNLQLVENTVKSDEKLVTRIRTILDAANRGSELTKRMLAFSRQQTLEGEHVEINGLIEDITDMIRRSIGTSITLHVRPSQQLQPVLVDKTQLETALLNLSINARDAMKDGGQLVIETGMHHLDEAYCANHENLSAGDFACITVTDTGHGIPAELIEKVVQPFFTTKPPEAGSGLGLSMIYGFVQQSGGHLKIDSVEGKGTSFHLFLPVLAAEMATSSAAQETPSEQSLPASNAPEATPKAAPGAAPGAAAPDSLAADIANRLLTINNNTAIPCGPEAADKTAETPATAHNRESDDPAPIATAAQEEQGTGPQGILEPEPQAEPKIEPGTGEQPAVSQDQAAAPAPAAAADMETASDRDAHQTSDDPVNNVIANDTAAALPAADAPVEQTASPPDPVTASPEAAVEAAVEATPGAAVLQGQPDQITAEPAQAVQPPENETVAQANNQTTADQPEADITGSDNTNSVNTNSVNTNVGETPPVEAAKAAAPPAAGQTPEAPAGDEVSEGADEPRSRVILIVEDNDAVRDVAVAMVEDMGHHVLQASGGAEGLELIKQHPEIDLLLSDVVMAGMNGPELAAETLKVRPDLKVLFASGYTQGAIDEIQGLANYLELINKPFTFEELSEKVTKAIELLEAA